jgi:hypothetical protein
MQTKVKINAKHDLSNYTMSAKNNQIIKHFDNFRSHIPILQKKVEVAKRELNKLQKDQKDQKEFDLNSLKIFNLEREIEEMENQINDTQNDKLKIDYQIKTMDKIFDYFDEENVNKEETYKEYLKIVDPTCHVNRNSIHTHICESCENKMSLNVSDGIMICKNCGLMSDVLIEDNKQSYNEGIIQQDNTYFSYKKITHFHECLEQRQGKERTDIPKEVFEKIHLKLQEERIFSYEKLSLNKIKEILKDLQLNRYYEHVTFIYTKLSGKNPIVIPPEIENRLEMMFKDVNLAFKKCKPTARKNFLSYNYVLHKCIQLIGNHDYLLHHFPLLKSPQKLQVVDSMWENICKLLKWEFYPSI